MLHCIGSTLAVSDLWLTCSSNPIFFYGKSSTFFVLCAQVHISANALLLFHDPGSLRTWLGLAACVLRFLRYSSFTRLRPQVRVSMVSTSLWCAPPLQANLLPWQSSP